MIERKRLLKELSRMAVNILNNYYGRLDGYSMKGECDVVTEADKAVEEAVVGEIIKCFPDDSIVAEEGHSREGSSSFSWIIDPLDGTTNFAHGFPFFAFSCALRKGNHTVAGIVDLPFMKETFYAEENGGAFLNEKLIGVSKEKSLKKSLLVTGFPYARAEFPDKLLKPVRNVIMNAQGLRRAGSAAIDLCYVACGRLDGFFETGLKPWDVAAGELILLEAGGKITDYSGNRFSLESDTLAVSNGHIHVELLEKVLSDWS